MLPPSGGQNSRGGDDGLLALVFSEAFDKYQCLTGGILGMRRNSNRQNGTSETFSPANGVVKRRMLQLSSEGYPDPQIITLGLSKKLITAPPSGSNDQLVAHIQWGTGKGKNEALIDFTQGQRVALTASTLIVDAFYAPTIDGADLVGPDLLISAEATYDTIGGNKAQFTDVPIVLGPPATTSPPRPLPAFARELVLLDNGQAPGNYIVTFSPVASGISPANVIVRGVTAGVADEGIPIPNGVDFYSVGSIAGGAIVYPLFRLFL